MGSLPSKTSSKNIVQPLTAALASRETSETSTTIGSQLAEATDTSATYNSTGTQCPDPFAVWATATTQSGATIVNYAGTILRQSPSLQLSKKLRRARLNEARETRDLDKARILTTAIVNDWQGNGLHPIDAIRNLATIDGGVDYAIEFWFLIVHRYVHLKCIYSGIFWKSIRQNKGNHWRYFKAFDDALTVALFHHWHGLVKASKEVDWDPTSLYLGLHCTFAHIASLLAMPATLGTYGPELATSPPLFRNAFHTVTMMMNRRIWLIKVERVAGPHLPRELVDMIVDKVSDKQICLSFTNPGGARDQAVRYIRIGKGEKGAGKDKYFPYRTVDANFLIKFTPTRPGH